MSDLLSLTSLFVSGMVLATLYFASLWWTVRTLSGVQYPWLLYFGSFAGRMVLLLGAVFLLMGGDWRRAVACMAGFLLARLFVIRWIGFQPASDLNDSLETYPTRRTHE